MNNEPSTTTIFRKDGLGVFAIFPYCPWNYRNKTCAGYAHTGQHMSIDYPYAIQTSRPAHPSEYQDLLDELKSIGYNPRIVRRASYRKMYN